MPLWYSCVARGGTILCSHQEGVGNFDETTRSILPNIPTRNDAKTTYNSHRFALMPFLSIELRLSLLDPLETTIMYVVLIQMHALGHAQMQGRGFRITGKPCENGCANILLSLPNFNIFSLILNQILPNFIKHHISFNSFFHKIKSLLLGIKCVFQHLRFLSQIKTNS